jgi:hypothetical protein
MPFTISGSRLSDLEKTKLAIGRPPSGAKRFQYIKVIYLENEGPYMQITTTINKISFGN